MIIDIEKCENCNNCFLACKDEYYDNDWKPHTLAQPRHGHRWMNILRREQGTFPYTRVAYLPKPCFHCGEDPPCINNATDGEIYKRPDGVVIINPEKSKGKKNLVSACPHGAIWWNDESQTPQKCTLCVHLLDDGWKQPRCAQACPTGALTFHRIEEEEVASFIKSNHLETFDGSPQETHSKAPIVLYKNLDLYQKCFISGSVATKKERVEECVEGVTVELLQDGRTIASEQTDVFGDYRFSGLPENSGLYEIKISHQNSVVTQTEIDLKNSCFAGITWI